MKNRTDISYRRAFLVMVFTTVVLSIGVTALWWRLHTSRSAQAEPSTAQTSDATPSSMQSTSTGQSATPSQPETALAPIQLSPQRMQSIGVQIGEVKYQPVNDEIRFYGNVQADERRLAYVQTRFAGWIRFFSIPFPRISRFCSTFLSKLGASSLRSENSSSAQKSWRIRSDNERKMY